MSHLRENHPKNVSQPKRHRHSHGFFMGIELSFWLPLAAVLFLTVGAVGVLGLASTNSSGRMIALADPYSCSFAPNGSIGCDGNICAECVSGRSVPISASYCFGMACGPTTVPVLPTNTLAPNQPTPTPKSSTPTPLKVNTPTPTQSAVAPPQPTQPADESWSFESLPTSAPVTPKPTKAPSLFNFLFLPAAEVQPTPSGKANGVSCQRNSECASTYCVPNVFGNYCGTTKPSCVAGAVRCSLKQDKNLVERCNQNGYWLQQEQCDGGCQDGNCINTVCSPNQETCEGTARKVCSSDGMRWQTIACGNAAVCKQGQCVTESLASCPEGGSCSSAGDYCTNQQNQKYVCVDGTWKQLLNGQRVAIVGCDQRRTGLYLAGLHDAADLLRSASMLSVDCSASSSIFDALDNSNQNACYISQISSNGSVRLSCLGSTPIADVAHSARHEAVKVWVAQNGSSQQVVNAYSEVVGCRREKTNAGIRYVFHKEQPVSQVGRLDCVEAFAEAVAMYLEQPCRMKEVYPLQYRFLSTSNDSPITGDPRCTK